jgi:hypothetical protein
VKDQKDLINVGRYYASFCGQTQVKEQVLNLNMIGLGTGV